MPNLAPVVDSLDQVPEPARQFYVQKDGKYHVDLAGTPAGFVPAADLTAANAKVVEFRDKNITLLQEVEPLRTIKTKFEGIDPDAAREALDNAGKLKAKGVKGADDLNVIVTTAVAAAVKPLEDKLSASEKNAEANAKRADDQTLRNTVNEAFVKAGGKPKALDFIVGKASAVFQVQAGKVVALPNQFSTDKPGDPISVAEWLTQQAKENEFVFEASNGGGAAPVRGGAAPRAGVEVLRDPTPNELGSRSADILAGKVRVEYSK